MNKFQLALKITSIACVMSAGTALGQELRSIQAATDACGSNADGLEARALACAEIISHPNAGIQDLTYALWQRAYVRCGDVTIEDTVADLMMSARLDPEGWKQQYSVTYEGSAEGFHQVAYETLRPWAERGCR